MPETQEVDLAVSMAQGSACTFAPAAERDADEIYALAFKNPEPFLRRVNEADVKMWTTDENWMCWVAKGGASGSTIALCNLMIPVAVQHVSTLEPAEFGALLTDPSQRGTGIGAVLATFALASYFWDTDPDSPTPIPLVAHVHVENQAPRKILRALGFEQRGRVEVRGSRPGFEHMPRDARGMVIGDEFEFPPLKRADLFVRMAGLLDRSNHTFHGPIGMTSQALLSLAAGLAGR